MWVNCSNILRFSQHRFFPYRHPGGGWVVGCFIITLFLQMTSGFWLLVTTMVKTILIFFSEFFDLTFIAAQPKIENGWEVGGVYPLKLTDSLNNVKPACVIPLLLCFWGEKLISGLSFLYKIVFDGIFAQNM